MDRQKNIKIWLRERDEIIYDGGLPATPRIPGIESPFTVQLVENRVLLRCTADDVFVDLYTRDGTPIATNEDGNFELPESADLTLTIEETDEMLVLSLEIYEGISVNEWFRETAELQLDEHPDLIPLSSDSAIDLLFDETIGQEEPLEIVTDFEREKLERAAQLAEEPKSNKYYYLAAVIGVSIVMGVIIWQGILTGKKRSTIKEVTTTYEHYFNHYNVDQADNPFDSKLANLIQTSGQKYPDSAVIKETYLKYQLLRYQQEAIPFVEAGDPVNLSRVNDKYSPLFQGNARGPEILKFTALVTEFNQFHLRWPRYPKWSDQAPAQNEIAHIHTKIDTLSQAYWKVHQYVTLHLARIELIGRFALNNISPKIDAWAEFWEAYRQAHTTSAADDNKLEYLFIRYPNLQEDGGQISSQPELLRLGISASGRTATQGGGVVDEFIPLVNYLKESGLPIVLDVSGSYHAVLNKLLTNQIELAVLNQRADLDCEQMKCAVPVAARKWQDQTFTDCYLYCRNDSPIQQLADLKGAVFAFTHYDLTTGYAMPLLYAMEQGYEPSDLFQNSYFAGGSIQALSDVVSGRADACAADEQTYQTAKQNGLAMDQLRTFESIGLRPMSTINVRSDLIDSYSSKLRYVLEAIEPSDLFPDGITAIHPYASWGEINKEVRTFFFNRLRMFTSMEKSRLGLKFEYDSNQTLADSVATVVETMTSRGGFAVMRINDELTRYRSLTRNLTHYISCRIHLITRHHLRLNLRLVDMETGTIIDRTQIDGNFHFVVNEIGREIADLAQSLPLRAEVTTVSSGSTVQVNYNSIQATELKQMVVYYRWQDDKIGIKDDLSRMDRYTKIGEGEIIESRTKAFKASFTPTTIMGADSTRYGPKVGDLVVTCQNPKVALTP